MHDININFLKDRKLVDSPNLSGTQIATSKSTSLKDQLPIFIAGGVALALIALTGGALLLVNNQKSATEKQIATLDAEIQRLKGQDAEIRRIQGEIDNVNQQIGILVNVFEQIKPWSAIMEELAALTPPQIQIHSFGNVDAPNNEAMGTWLGIAATTENYTRVNDYVLSLKNSDLIDSEQVSLYGATEIENPNGYRFSDVIDKEDDSTSKEGEVITVEGINSRIDSPDTNLPTEDETEEEAVSLPKVIAFKIDLQLTDKPSAELISLLNRRGAIGLVSRLNRLRSKGALNIETETMVEQETPAE